MPARDAGVVIAVPIATVLALLGLLHVYWGVGGIGGGSSAIPEVDGKAVFTPSRLSCFVVAGALFTAMFLVASRGGVLASPLPAAWTKAGCAGVGVVFLLRAIGDFRLVGLFKTVRGTAFATWDSRLFTPLCIALGTGSLWVAFARPA